MRTLDYTHALEVAAPAVWDVLADFGGFLDWYPTPDATIETTGDGEGMVRHMTIPGFGLIAERLDDLDHENQSLTYTLVDGAPLGMQTYTANVRVHATSPETCELVWQGQFSGDNEDEIASGLEGSYAGMSGALGVAAAKG